VPQPPAVPAALGARGETVHEGAVTGREWGR